MMPGLNFAPYHGCHLNNLPSLRKITNNGWECGVVSDVEFEEDTLGSFIIDISTC